MTDDRTDWLEWRRQGIGSSDVAGILGLSPWASPWSVWADKVGLTPLDDHGETEAMDFGRRAEVMLGPWFHEKTGLWLVGEQTWASNPDEPWMQCTPDGFVAESPDAAITDCYGPGEIKVTSDRAEKWEEEGIPVAYQSQATWHAAVTGYSKVWFLVLHLAFGRPQFRVYELDIDPEDIGYVVEKARILWEENILTGVPPDVDAHPATTRAISAAYHDSDTAAEPVELDPLADDIAALEQAKADAKEATERAALLGNRLRAAMAEREVGTVGGQEAVTWKQSRALDVEALLAAEPELCRPFLRLDVGAVTKAHRKAVEPFKTMPGSRRLLIKTRK